MPSTMRYHPNTLKSCFLIYPIRNLITSIDTTNATAQPVSRIAHSMPPSAIPLSRYFAIFKRLAPAMTGIAIKNVNSAATVLDTPSRSAPTIVAPDLDVPGKIPATSWNTPIASASGIVIWESYFTLGFTFLFRFSIRIKATPNRISITATVT